MDIFNALNRLIRRPRDDYELVPRDDIALPPLNGHSQNVPKYWRRQGIQFFTVRRFLLLLAAVPVLLTCAILSSGIPPSYASYWQYERSLPQHNLSLTSPEGRNGSYLRFSNTLWGHGWGNILQERILLSHLASLSNNRSYVFEPYTWSHLSFPYTLYDFALRPSRIPLNAIISGPGAGGGTRIPRAISSEWWQTVCPREKRVVLDSNVVNKGLEDAEGSEIMNKWVDTVNGITEGCVEVAQNSPSVFEWGLFGSPRIVSIWPSLSTSPILQSFSWSPLVASVVHNNLPLLTSKQRDDLPQTFPGLVAVHIRRGDYVRHCQRLSQWSTIFLGYNTFSTLPESSRFDPPPVSSPDERLAYYTRRCWPSYNEITNRITEVQQEWEGKARGRKLDRIFILTNGGWWWSRSLKEKLAKHGWAREKVKVSSDLALGREGKYVDFAVDMAIAERAEVFIGNGFSSFTSNVIMLRMAREADPKSNHLW